MTRMFWLPCVLVSSLAIGCWTAANELDDPLTTLRPAHPRLLLTAERQQEIEQLADNDELLARLIKQNHVNAVAMLDASRVRYEIPDGKRLLAQSRKCIERVVGMSLAYRLTGEQRFADSAIEEMLVATRFKDWNPSHFLDTAEMTTALAIGYDWLYDVITEADRERIRAAIVKHGLLEGKRVYQSGGWWSAGDNNWNQVCNGGMIIGALAIAEDEPDLAREIIRFAVKSIPNGVRVYDPDGAYPEGPGYWQYGTSYTCLTIDALNTALGTNFGIDQTPGLAETGWYRLQTIGPTGLYFNYADGGSGARLSSTMFLFAKIYHQPVFSWWHRQRLVREIPVNKEIEPNRQDRFFALEIAWYDRGGQQPTAAELPLDAYFNSRQDIVTMRGAWGDPTTAYLGFKAGDNQTNHGHLDIGAFVLDAAGVRWAVDLGSDDYNMPGYFGGRRWQYYRMVNHSHNTLVINDENQDPTAHCRVTAFHSTPERAVAIVDMTAAYRGQARSVLRGIELLDRRVVHIRDELQGVDGEVRWGMVTEAEIDLDGSRAKLVQDGQTLMVEITQPATAKFEILSTKPPSSREKQNSGTQMLATTVSARADQPLEISVVLQAVSPTKPLTTVSPQPLSDWPGTLKTVRK